MMDRLTELQMKFVNLRLGTFIHFNSATAQFYSGEIEDWEFDHENAGAPRRYPFDENAGIPMRWTVRSGRGWQSRAACASRR